MALSFKVRNTFLMTLVYCLAFDILCSTKFLLAKADLIHDVCTQTKIDPAFCEKALRSDPHSSTANLPTLAQIAINLAESHTQSGIALLDSLIKKTTDPKLKETYNSCSENYKDARSDLNDCTFYLRKKDYATLNLRGSAALDGPHICDENFSPPSQEPPQLRQSSKNVQAICAAICAMANMLQAKIF